MAEDRIMMKEGISRKEILVSLASLRERMEVPSVAESIEPAFRAMVIPEANLIDRQFFSRVVFKKTNWNLYPFGYNTNQWYTLPFQVLGDTLNENADTWRYGFDPQGVLVREIFVCRQSGMYRLNAFWESLISLPAVDDFGITAVDLGYSIIKKSPEPHPVDTVFGINDPSAIKKIGGVGHSQANVGGIMYDVYLRGWKVSGADDLVLMEGDRVYATFYLTGINGTITFFDLFETRLSIARTGDLYTSEECC